MIQKPYSICLTRQAVIPLNMQCFVAEIAAFDLSDLVFASSFPLDATCFSVCDGGVVNLGFDCSIAIILHLCL